MSFLWTINHKRVFEIIRDREGTVGFLQNRLPARGDRNSMLMLVKHGYLRHGVHPTEVKPCGGEASTLFTTETGRVAYNQATGAPAEEPLDDHSGTTGNPLHSVTASGVHCAE